MPDSDDYQMNFEHWQHHKPVGKAESIEWEKQRPVITHAVGKVKNSDAANKIHWTCFSCLHKTNPQTGKYFIANCPVCSTKIENRGNIQHYEEPQAVATELTGFFSIPLRYYAHPHPESYENVSNQRWQEVRQRDAEVRRVQELEYKEGERFAEIIEQQQREKTAIKQQRDEERVLVDQQRLMLRERQRQHAHSELQQKREQRHITMMQLRETQRLQLVRERQEARHNAAVKQQPRQNDTVYMQWENH